MHVTKNPSLCLITTVLVLMVASPSFAKAKKTARAKKGKAKVEAPVSAANLKFTDDQIEAVKKMMGKYEWKMDSEKVIGMLTAEIREEYKPLMKTDDMVYQDRIRKEMQDKIDDIKKSHVKFEGKRTPWEVSLVDREFAQNNNESMVAMWEKKARRFYFFHHDRLWKVFIAFNADLYEGKTFDDFYNVMKDRFGVAEKKFEKTIKGEDRFAYLQWPETGDYGMRAIDYTSFYGNFCMVIYNPDLQESVLAGRNLGEKKRGPIDPLVQSVTQKGEGEESGSAANANVVDQITGKKANAPEYSDTESGGKKKNSKKTPSISDDPMGETNPKKKKVSDDPLEGMGL